MSDLAATGSNDGYLRLWKVETGRTVSERGLSSLCEIPLKGYVNSISFGPKGKFCVAAVGQEHRLGRWDRIPKAKNRVAVVKLYDDSMTHNPDEGPIPDDDEHPVADGDEPANSDSSSSSDSE